ncbi:alpha28-takusan isoform X2 [Mus musculus]|uniref:alpha28-takusan isoform X2 n=1 Tax=Mus musculus TaxID=10090 RepID=UPI0003D78FD1|nr:alpha28-takusan isoform X2 [Mus musculus]|eukprot:XP_011243104.1 PREDICTED: uncharacterized protein Gm38690 isoform X1 [Mus musculus]
MRSPAASQPGQRFLQRPGSSLLAARSAFVGSASGAAGVPPSSPTLQFRRWVGKVESLISQPMTSGKNELQDHLIFISEKALHKRNLQSHLLMELNQLKKKVDMLRRHRNKKVLEDKALVLQYLWDLKGLHKDQ